MSRRCILSTILTAAVACLSSTHKARADNLILNGGFETPVINGLWVGYPTGHTDLAPWAITDGSVDIVRSYWQPYEGDQSLDLNNFGGGAIEQSFATEVGRSYSLTFAYANNPDGGEASGVVNVLGTTILFSQAVVHAGSTHGNMDWQVFHSVFMADSTTTTLRFVGTNSGAFGLTLDAVSVTAIDSVPEPSSLAMGGLGLIAAGGFAIRRNPSNPRPASA